MKKLFIISILTLVLSGAVFAQAQNQLPLIGTESEIKFHGMSFGTTMQEFIRRVGNPVNRDSINGYDSLVYNNLIINGYHAFMVAFFNNNRLEGGTYYFDTQSNEEREKCYLDMQQFLLSQYGEARLLDPIFHEKAPYGSTWRMDSGFVKLEIDTRRNDPVSIWYSSPKLTALISSR